jgi:5-methylcytosine-specific restriction endonuclease McrA
VSILLKPYQKKRKKECHEITRDGRLIIDTSTAAGRDMRDGITAQAWSRDNGICGICGRYVCLLECVRDHIIPCGMGGSTRDDALGNIQPAHPDCNMLKGSQRNFTLKDEIVP